MKFISNLRHKIFYWPSEYFRDTSIAKALGYQRGHREGLEQSREELKDAKQSAEDAEMKWLLRINILNTIKVEQEGGMTHLHVAIATHSLTDQQTVQRIAQDTTMAIFKLLMKQLGVEEKQLAKKQLAENQIQENK